MNGRRLGVWIIAITAVSSVVGIGLFVGSVHSGGAALWLAGFIAPPLLLEVTGQLNIEQFSLWVLAIVVLQLLLIASLVYGLAWIKRDRKAEQIDRGAI
jgi:ABC-type Na+ efflux pump permease subunit